MACNPFGAKVISPVLENPSALPDYDCKISDNSDGAQSQSVGINLIEIAICRYNYRI